jgi:hypothetical protein
MRGRDLLILAAVLLVGGFAIADTLRDETSDGGEPAASPTTTRAETAPTTTVDEDLGRAHFPFVRRGGGSIVLAQTGSCAIREFDLPTGLEFNNVVARSSCQLWAAPVTAKVAVGIGEPVGDAVPFRFIDLARPGRNLGTSDALFGFLVWSDDGQRAAWCNRLHVGIDLELGEFRHRLPGCPAAYTPEGRVALAEGDRLVVDGHTVLTASGGITNVHYGSDGSVAVDVEGRRIERYRRGRLTDALDLPERFEGRMPNLSPDNCSAAFRADDRIRILDVGCSRLGPQGTVFPGHAASWSPDGTSIAIGGASEVTFYDLETGGVTTWPIGAVSMVWRRS